MSERLQVPKFEEFDSEDAQEAAQMAQNALTLARKLDTSRFVEEEKGGVYEEAGITSTPESVISQLYVSNRMGDVNNGHHGEIGNVKYTVDTLTMNKNANPSVGQAVGVERFTLNSKTGAIQAGAVNRLTGKRAERAAEIINRRAARKVGRVAMGTLDNLKFE